MLPAPLASFCYAIPLKYNWAMTFDPRTVQARLVLSLILSTDVPRLAWDALEAGIDGVSIRRLAAMDFPTFFEVQEVLPSAIAEMHLPPLSKREAALHLAKLRAKEILETGSDPFKHLRDFEQLWCAADFCRELLDYGNLDDDVYVALSMGQQKEEIRSWLLQRLNRLVLAGEKKNG
jgi:hypothetical protein